MQFYDLGNLCQMFHRILEQILIAYQEEPSKIPKICETGMRITDKLRSSSSQPLTYNLKESNMAEKKQWFQQKTTWVGLATIVGSAGGFLTGQVDAQTSIYGIVGGLLAIFMRQGIENTK